MATSINPITDVDNALHIHKPGAKTDQCPWCHQPITHEEFEEITAKIKKEEHEKLKERESALRNKFSEERKTIEENAKQEKTKLESEYAAKNKAMLEKAAKREVEVRKETASLERDKFKKEITEANTKVEKANKEKATAEANLAKTKSDLEIKSKLQIKEAVQKTRDAMEKDKENAIAKEKASKFEENQKLTRKVGELQRQLEQKTSDELGEGGEIDLFNVLKAAFPGDHIERIKKGQPGADIRQIIYEDGQVCGRIVYDSKNRKQWRNEYVTKLRDDQMADKAEHAVLSTQTFPANQRQVTIRDGVIVVNPARVEAIVTMLRDHIKTTRHLRLSQNERIHKTEKLYEFINSDRCENLLKRQQQLADDLQEIDNKEIKAHEKVWEVRGKKTCQLIKAQADFRTEVNTIVESDHDSD